jgi:membrane protein implicated in regulation of membrane protease activity
MLLPALPIIRPHMDLPTFYLICLGVGLLFTVVSAFAANVFGGHEAPGDLGADGHAEAGFDSGDMPGFSALSPTTIASFITAFGAFGMILVRIEATRSPWVNIPLAMVGAMLVAGSVLALFRSIFRATQSSSESRVGTLAGQAATIITPIPAGGVGEIAYVQGGSRYTAPAREEDGIPVAGGSTVKITRVVGTQFYVRLS